MICLRLLNDCVRAAASRTFCTAGRSRPMRMAMTARMTSSWNSVIPRRGDRVRMGGLLKGCNLHVAFFILHFAFCVGPRSQPNAKCKVQIANCKLPLHQGRSGLALEGFQGLEAAAE